MDQRRERLLLRAGGEEGEAWREAREALADLIKRRVVECWVAWLAVALDPGESYEPTRYRRPHRVPDCSCTPCLRGHQGKLVCRLESPLNMSVSIQNLSVMEKGCGKQMRILTCAYTAGCVASELPGV